jgi:hypothetical protein
LETDYCNRRRLITTDGDEVNDDDNGMIVIMKLVIYTKSYPFIRSYRQLYGLDDRVSSFRFPVGAGNFSCHHRSQNGSWTYPASYLLGKRAHFLGVKRLVSEDNHSSPSSAEAEK